MSKAIAVGVQFDKGNATFPVDDRGLSAEPARGAMDQVAERDAGDPPAASAVHLNLASTHAAPLDGSIIFPPDA